MAEEWVRRAWLSYFGGSGAVFRVLTGMRSGEQGSETI
jgi:hypothetical protein